MSMKKLLISVFVLSALLTACSDNTDVKTFVNANGYTFYNDSLVTFQK